MPGNAGICRVIQANGVSVLRATEIDTDIRERTYDQIAVGSTPREPAEPAPTERMSSAVSRSDERPGVTAIGRTQNSLPVIRISCAVGLACAHQDHPILNGDCAYSFRSLGIKKLCPNDI